MFVVGARNGQGFLVQRHVTCVKSPDWGPVSSVCADLETEGLSFSTATPVEQTHAIYYMYLIARNGAAGTVKGLYTWP